MYLALQTVLTQGGKEEGVKRAVKTLLGNASEANRDEFVHEAEASTRNMCCSSANVVTFAQMMLQISHENCVALIGVAVQQRPWLMVLEYLPCK